MMTRLKVWCIYSGYTVLFAVTFVVILAVLTGALVMVPTGIFFGAVGGALLIADTPYIVTELSPKLMLFGGLFAAFAAAFLGFAAVKIGFLISRLFRCVRKHCDRLRGW